MQLRVGCPPVISYATTKMCHKSGDRYVCVCGFGVFVDVGWGTKYLKCYCQVVGDGGGGDGGVCARAIMLNYFHIFVFKSIHSKYTFFKDTKITL